MCSAVCVTVKVDLGYFSSMISGIVENFRLFEPTVAPLFTLTVDHEFFIYNFS